MQLNLRDVLIFPYLKVLLYIMCGYSWILQQETFEDFCGKLIRPRPGTPLHRSCCAGHKRIVLGHTWVWAMLNLLTWETLSGYVLLIWSKCSRPTVHEQYSNISMYSCRLPTMRVAVCLQAFRLANRLQSLPGASVSPQGRHLLRRWQPHSLLDCYKHHDITVRHLSKFDTISTWKKSARISKHHHYIDILLMAEILHHLGCMKPYTSWDKLPINWCRISAINSMGWNAET